MSCKNFKNLLFLALVGFVFQEAKAPFGSLDEYMQNFVQVGNSCQGNDLRDKLNARVVEAENQSRSEIFSNNLSGQIIAERLSLGHLIELCDLQAEFAKSDNTGKVAISEIIQRGLCLSTSLLMYSKFKFKGADATELYWLNYGIIFNQDVLKFKAFLSQLSLLDADAFDKPDELFGDGRFAFSAWTNLTKLFYEKIIKHLRFLIETGQKNEAFSQIDGLASVLLESSSDCKSAFVKALFKHTSKAFAIFLLEKRSSWDGVLREKILYLRELLKNFDGGDGAQRSVSDPQRAECGICANKILTAGFQTSCKHGVIYHPACLLNLPIDFIQGGRHCPICRKVFDFNEIFEKWLSGKLIALSPRPVTASSPRRKGHRFMVPALPAVQPASMASLPPLVPRGQVLVASR